MNLYTPDGWINLGPLYDNKYTFIYGIGSRAIGKTYGIIKESHERHVPTILMRRLTPQIEAAIDPVEGAFAPYCRDNNLFYRTYKQKGNRYHVYISEYPDELDKRIEPDRHPDFCCISLSTLSGLRGIDFTSYPVCFFDEYIAEAHERPIKNEYEAFLQGYETLNRNKGTDRDRRPALKVIMMGNALKLANPYFIGEQKIERVAEMIRDGQEVKYFPQNGRMFINYFNSTISEAKKTQDIYKGAEDSAFARLALLNKFKELGEFSRRSVDFAQYQPYAQIGIIRIEYCPNDDSFYIRIHRNENARAPFIYPDTETGYKIGVFNHHRELYFALANGRIKYQDLTSKCLCEELLSL